jgi:hypothetical protein
MTILPLVFRPWAVSQPVDRPVRGLPIRRLHPLKPLSVRRHPDFRRSGRKSKGNAPKRLAVAEASNHKILGRVSNVWNGGGEGSVHSSVLAPAPHGLSSARTRAMR